MANQQQQDTIEAMRIQAEIIKAHNEQVAAQIALKEQLLQQEIAAREAILELEKSLHQLRIIQGR